MRGSVEPGQYTSFDYTQVLDDHDPNERAMGIEMALEYLDGSDLLAVYTDRGISKGMQAEIDFATERRTLIEYRSIAEQITLSAQITISQ